jgi:hypothetical protein
MPNLINVTHTPPTFSPVYTDGLFFTISGNTNYFKFRYVYDIYVDGVLAFQGKATPNPFGLGIVDCSRILKTYVNNIPISMWNTTPIYTHQTFPFSRPYEDVTINYELFLGMEYADSEFGIVSGFTGVQEVVSGVTTNIIGPPSIPTGVYKTYQATMGVNGRATQQNFDMSPFVLSGTPVNSQPTTSGLFLTNSPRIRNIQESEYYTLAFTNWWLDSSVVSEPYYSQYKFYDESGGLIRTDLYQNLTTNGGGPIHECGWVYQSYYGIEPKSGATYNTLYVGAGPVNIDNFPSNCAQYTVQLFGGFTGSTVTPTPTPTITPTPTPLPPCGDCYYTDVINPSPTAYCNLSWFNCTTNQYTSILLPPWSATQICSCPETMDYDCYLDVTQGARCETPQPCEFCITTGFNNDNEESCDVRYYDCDLGYYTTITVLSLTSSPTVCACRDTWTSDCVSGITATEYGFCDTGQPCEICEQVSVVNNDEFSTCEVYYFDCDTQTFEYLYVPPQTAYLVCGCYNSFAFDCPNVTLELGSPCEPPLPTITPTPTPTPTPTSTPLCLPKAWLISVCTTSCSGGVCQCVSSSSLVVYTTCSVTNITLEGTLLYTDSGLTTPFVGFFSRNGYIWYSNGGVTSECLIGGPC